MLSILPCTSQAVADRKLSKTWGFSYGECDNILLHKEVVRLVIVPLSVIVPIKMKKPRPARVLAKPGEGGAILERPRCALPEPCRAECHLPRLAEAELQQRRSCQRRQRGQAAMPAAALQFSVAELLTAAELPPCGAQGWQQDRCLSSS